MSILCFFVVVVVVVVVVSFFLFINLLLHQSHILRRNGSSGSIADDREKAVGVMMRESGGLLKEGWIHIRSTSSWSKRWLQVCNDRLFWYKNEKVHELQGIIALGGCNLIPRRRKASTPEDMLEVSHPERRNIFARVGPQNERLAPWSSHGQHHVRELWFISFGCFNYSLSHLRLCFAFLLALLTHIYIIQ